MYLLLFFLRHKRHQNGQTMTWMSQITNNWTGLGLEQNVYNMNLGALERRVTWISHIGQKSLKYIGAHEMDSYNSLIPGNWICVGLEQNTLLKKNHTYTNIFIEFWHARNYRTLVIGFIQTYGCVYHKINIKSDYPHHVIIKHRAMCRWDSKASKLTSYTCFYWYNVTVLDLLSVGTFGT